MKILFYGYKGWIGGMILEEWLKIPNMQITCSPTRLNFENRDLIEKEIKDHDRIFLAIGRTYGYDEEGKLINNIDYLENHLQENINDNIGMQLLIAILSKKHGKHATYINTGCIFSSDTTSDSKIYTEEDRPDYFGSAYSIVKGLSDNLLREYNNVAVLRIRMPICNFTHSRNFITKLLTYPNICSYPNSMTYLPDFIPIFIDISIKGYSGIYNMTNKGSISHDEILQYYNNHKDNKTKHEYQLITEEKLNSMLLSKRSNNILDVSKISDRYTIRHIKDCIYEAIDCILRV